MLTVLLATRNRARILREVLCSYCRLLPPSSGWKLVVVDNGSTDETAQVIASFGTRLPLHTQTEPKLGKNYALNTGLGLVEGDLAVFTDDDAFPFVDWLVQLRKAADNQPAYSMFGGTIVPRWEAPPPPWVQWVDQPTVYTLTDPSLKEGPVPPYLIFGPNMAVRNSIFQTGIRLDPSIGPRGRSYPMGSETELVVRLGRQGQKAWHVPGAVVEHFVRKEQLNKAWVLQRAIYFGRGQYRLFRADEDSKRMVWMDVPLYLFRAMFKQAVLASVAGVFFWQKGMLRRRWKFNFLRGQATEARILARERRVRAQPGQSTSASCGDTGERTPG